MLKSKQRQVHLARACAAMTNQGPTWGDCWRGLLAGNRPFTDLNRLLPSWPESPPASAILDFGHLGGQPPFSKRYTEMLRAAGMDLRPKLDELFIRHRKLRVSTLVASSAGDPGPLAAMVDHDVAPHLASEPMTRELRSMVLRAFDPAVLGDALGRELPTAGVFGACASSLVAVSHAADRIRAGLDDVVLVIALDSVSRFACVGFGKIGANSKEGCTPYDRNRDGTTVGEGVVGLILAREGILQPSEIAAHIEGTSVNCDATHLVEPNPEGVAGVVRDALVRSDLRPDEIKGIYWHGTGTRQNDKTESAVASLVFGDLSPPCTSTKGALGHTMGASGGFNVLAAGMTFETGLMPHVAGTTDAEYPNLDLVLGAPRQLERGPVLVTALGFGGINAAVVLQPPEQ